MVKAVYPQQIITGDGSATPWQTVWTPADILARDPGRVDISITGAEVLPVLVANPGSADGSYTTAQIAAINVGNYPTWYKQRPGTDITNSATDYAADLTGSTLTIQYKAPALYAVKVETLSRAAPLATLEARSYVYSEFVNTGFLQDGTPDAAGTNREVDIGDADIYVISNPTPADPVLTAAKANLIAAGKTVCDAADIAAAKKCICDASKAAGKKLRVNMVGHGRPGSIKIGSERINDDTDGVETPAAFQKDIDDCTSRIDFTSCSTADGKEGDKFLQDFANSIGIASGWTVPITVEGAVKILGITIFPGYFDVEATASKMSDSGVKATEPIMSSPTAFRPAFFDIFYYGADDGFLYGQTAEGGIVPGFPVDMRSLHLPGVTTTVTIHSRPAIYFGNDTFGSLYFTTTMGHIISLTPDGVLRWVTWPDPTGHDCSSTPAVTADGSLFVAINGANGPRVWKLNSSNGFITGQSPPLGLPNSDCSSIAVGSNLVYVGVTKPFPSLGSLFVLDSNLVVRSTGIAQGEGVAAPPFVNGQFMFDGTLGGNLYKINSVTTNPDRTFGPGGHMSIGEPMATSLYAVERVPGQLELYTGTTAGRVYKVDVPNSLKTLVFDSAVYGPAAAIQGLVVVPSGTSQVMAFGAGHNFYELPLSNPASAFFIPDRGLPGSGFSTAPTYAGQSQVFGIGNLDGYVYTFPRVF